MNETEIIADENKQELYVIRYFESSKEKVFNAFIDPKILVQWYMSEERQMEIKMMEPTEGGKYLFQLHNPSQGFKGVFHEVITCEKITRTREFLGLPFKLDPLLEITTFEKVDEKEAKVTIQMICPSVDYRNGMLNSEMQSTFQITFGLLDNLLKTS